MKAIGALRLGHPSGDPIVDALREIEQVRATGAELDAVPEGETETAITERFEIDRIRLAG